MTPRVNAFGQPIGPAVEGWTPPQRLPRESLLGRYCRVEPLEIVLACEHTAATRALHGPKPDTPLTADLETARQALRGR